MKYIIIKDIHRNNIGMKQKFGIRVRRKYKTRGNRRHYEKFLDVNFLAKISFSYYKDILNIKEVEANRIKKDAIIISKCNTKIFDINEVLLNNNISARDIVIFYNTIMTCTATEVIISDAIELTHFTYSDHYTYMWFHLLLNFNKDTRQIYSCYYQKDNKLFYVQNEDKASYLFFK